jgi:hypothetical protein
VTAVASPSSAIAAKGIAAITAAAIATLSHVFFILLLPPDLVLSIPDKCLLSRLRVTSAAAARLLYGYTIALFPFDVNSDNQNILGFSIPLIHFRKLCTILIDCFCAIFPYKK